VIKRSLLAVACLAAFSGCVGEKHHETTVGETEGIWVDAGELDYHIQGSRILNPYQVPDDRYLTGMPEDPEKLKADETYFAVFLRIENKTEHSAHTAEEFEIEDTQGEVYEPIEIDPESNPYAYAPTELGEKEVIPHPDSSQEMDSTQGSMLLFKIPVAGYSRRPLELIIHAPEDSEEGPEEAKVGLDV
jgi:Zn-finger nucleic acid-binding protein